MEMVDSVETRVAVITGAGSGIGRAVAERLAPRYRLLLADRNAAALEDVQSRLLRDGADVALQACDIADSESVAELAQRAGEQGSVGALVHSAGVSASMGDARTILEVNLLGTARIIALLGPLLAPGGAAVCIASMSGHRRRAERYDELLAEPLAEGVLDQLVDASEGQQRAAYALSKRGVIVLCERKVRDFAERGTRIVSVSPGVIDTEMGRRESGDGTGAVKALRNTPLGRVGDPMEIAATVEFLLGAGGGYITGTDIRVDGGTIPGMRYHAPAKVRDRWDDPWQVPNAVPEGVR